MINIYVGHCEGKTEHVQFQRRFSQVIIFRTSGVQELSSKGEVVDVQPNLGRFRLAPSTDDLNGVLPRLGMAAPLVEGFGGRLIGCVESTDSAPGKSSAQGSRGLQRQEPRRRLEMPTAARFARGESNPPC